MERKNLLLFVVGGLIVVFGLAFFVSPLASSSPDGLEKVSIDQGFDDTAEDHALADSPLADYGVEGVEDEGLSTGLSGIIGVAITFGLGMIVFGALRTMRARRSPSQAAQT
jgi:cobalt/nickel transport system permease protein